MSVTARQPIRHTVGRPSQRAWVISAVLLMLAGGIGVVATFRHWTHCWSFTTPTCVTLDDQTGTLPLLSTDDPASTVLLGGLCALGVALAWLSALVSARLRPVLTVCGVVVGLQSTVAALVVLAQPRFPRPATAVLESLWFYLVPDLAAVVFVRLLLSKDDALSGADRARWIVLTVAATVFGAIPAAVEMAVLELRHPHYADAVPGSGYGLAVLLGGAGVGLLVVSGVEATRRHQPAPPPGPGRQNLVTVRARAI